MSGYAEDARDPDQTMGTGDAMTGATTDATTGVTRDPTSGVTPGETPSAMTGATTEAHEYAATTDHDVIRRWAEDRHATPATVGGEEGDGVTGELRLDFDFGNDLEDLRDGHLGRVVRGLRRARGGVRLPGHHARRRVALERLPPRAAPRRLSGTRAAAWGGARERAAPMRDTEGMGFTRAELQSYHGRSIPDLMPEHPRLVFAGINPGLWTAATGVPFAYPGNRFYPALVAAGIIPRMPHIDVDGMAEADRRMILDAGIGIIERRAPRHRTGRRAQPGRTARGRRAAGPRRRRLAGPRRGDRRAHGVPAGVRAPARGGRPSARSAWAGPSSGWFPTRAA